MCKESGKGEKEGFEEIEWAVERLPIFLKNSIPYAKHAFRIQKLRFGYKYSFVSYKYGFSI